MVNHLKVFAICLIAFPVNLVMAQDSNEPEKLRERIKTLEAENDSLRKHNQELKSDTQKQRLGGLLKQLFQMQKESAGRYFAKDDPATKEKMATIAKECDSLLKELAGDDDSKKNSISEEVVKKYAPEYADAFTAAQEASKTAMCANNLSQIYRAMHVYVAAFGKNKIYPPHVGEEFLLCLLGKCKDKSKHKENYSDKAPLKGCDDVIKCASASTPKGSIDYRGPKQFIPKGVPDVTIFPSALMDSCPADLPIACDKAENHKDGGHVLYFDGRVKFLKGKEYEAALKMTE